jgi:glycerol-3-phosphate O-acyltransferase
MGKGWLRALRRKTPGEAEEDLAGVIRDGGSAALFLKRPPAMLGVATGKVGPRRSLSEGDDLIRALFEIQRGRPHPILLVPQVFVWTKLPDRRQGNVVDAILGSREWPGKIRTTVQFLKNYNNVILRAGEPVDLAEFLASTTNEASGAEDDGALTRRLTYALLRKLERERRAVVGPVRKGNERMRSEVIKSVKLQSIIRDLAGEGTKEREVLTTRANAMLRELEAQPEPGMIRMLDLVLDTLVNRIYDGLEVDGEGLERVRQAAMKGLPSFCRATEPRRLLDDVVRLLPAQPPAPWYAGDNLAFFRWAPSFEGQAHGSSGARSPAIGSRGGRRRVHASLIREGTRSIFLEGRARARASSCLQLGLLNMVAEAARRSPTSPSTSFRCRSATSGSSRLYVRELREGKTKRGRSRLSRRPASSRSLRRLNISSARSCRFATSG